MVDRRGFLGAVTCLPLLWRFSGAGRPGNRGGYATSGESDPSLLEYFDVKCPRAMDAVDHVTLDGRRVDGCYALSERHGWLRRYTDEPPYTERLTGRVRVVWL